MSNAPQAIFAGARPWEAGEVSSPDDEFSRVRAYFIFCVIATCLDAAATVVHLSRGATELNPVWLTLIEQTSPLAAMAVRVATGLVLLAVLLVFWRRPLARAGFLVVIAAFVPLTLYHLFLLIYMPLA